MDQACLQELLDLGWLHLLIVHPVVPYGKSGTWGSSDDPIGVGVMDDLAGLSPVRLFGEILGLTIRLGRSNVHRCQTSDVEISSGQEIVICYGGPIYVNE